MLFYALELFKKTLPAASASLLQLQETSADRRQQALAAIRVNHRPELNFIALALRGRKAGFEEVIGMIDEMVAIRGNQKVPTGTPTTHKGSQND